MSSTTIVVPCYNEARRLETHRFLDYALANEGVDFLFVDDGSTDDTLPMLDRLQQESPQRIVIARHETNRGKACAVRTGLQAALRRGSAYVGFWDADLATPLESIAEFRRVLDRRPDVELVIGTRLPRLGCRIERAPVRRLLGKVFVTAVSWLFHLKVHDSQCGAKLFRANRRLQRLLERPWIARWIFDVEFLARLKAEVGAEVSTAVYELPLDEWREVAGSKVRPADFVRAAAELLAIWRAYRSDCRTALRPGRDTASPGSPAGRDESTRRAA